MKEENKENEIDVYDHRGMKNPNNKYRENFPNELIGHMAQGKSFGTFCNYLYKKYDLRVTRKTLYNWAELYPEFKEAHDIGKEASLDFYETLMACAASGKNYIDEDILDANGLPFIIKPQDINPTMVIFPLKTRFHRDYGEKQQIDHISTDDSLKITFIKPEEKEWLI